VQPMCVMQHACTRLTLVGYCETVASATGYLKLSQGFHHDWVLALLIRSSMLRLCHVCSIDWGWTQQLRCIATATVALTMLLCWVVGETVGF
jgi:hypothetical protein